MAQAVVILAGGKGSRFWPRSRLDQPKQFLSLMPGEPTLFQATVARGAEIVSPEHVYAVLPEALVPQALEQAPDLQERLIVEPCARDTAAAVALATHRLAATLGRDTLLFFVPADHYVPDTGAFRDALTKAGRVAVEFGSICILGIQPVRPETAYGYVVPGEARGDGHEVREFVEKPRLDHAWKLTTQGALWNVGVFVAQAGVLLDAVQENAPEIHEATRQAASGEGTDLLEQVRPVSFDFAVLEHARNIRVVRASFPWDDVGTWAALERLVPPDAAGNVRQGDIVAEGTERTILVNDDPRRQLVVLGLRDVVCVSTPDGVLVAAKDRLSGLKDVYPLLRRHATSLESRIPVPADATVVDKPWGRELWWALTDRYCAKVLEVAPGEALSRQYHEVKAESLFVVGGSGTAEVDGNVLDLRPGVTFDLAPGTIHRFEAGEQGLVLLETSTPEIEDVVRLEDRYGRVGGTARVG